MSKRLKEKLLIVLRILSSTQRKWNITASLHPAKNFPRATIALTGDTLKDDRVSTNRIATYFFAKVVFHL